MGLMSDGMAVAMYTTLSGLVGSILVQTQYYLLDEATAKLFALATDLTEVFVVSVLEREKTRMDDFGNYPREKAFDPFSVMLFKGLQVVAFLFFIALFGDEPGSAREGKIETKAEFIISMAWPDDHPDDIDLYAEDPLGNFVWYHQREGGFMVLDRDDRGSANNSITVDGRKISQPDPPGDDQHPRLPGRRIHHQCATISSPLRAGRCRSLSRSRRSIPPSMSSPMRISPSTAWARKKTALRFKTAANGNVLDVQHMPRLKSLIQLTRNVRRQGNK